MEQRDTHASDIPNPNDLDLLSQVPGLKGKKVKVRKVEQKNDGSYTLRDTTLFVKPRDQNTEPTPVDPGVEEVEPEKNPEGKHKRALSEEKDLSVNVFGVKPERANMTTPRSDNKQEISFEDGKTKSDLIGYDDALKTFIKHNIAEQSSLGDQSLSHINQADTYSTHSINNERTTPQLRRSVSETNVFRLPPKVNSVLNTEDTLKQEYLNHIHTQKHIIGEQIRLLREEINDYMDGLQKYFNSRLDAYYDNFSKSFELFKKKCHEYRTVDTSSKTEFTKARHDVKIVSFSFFDTKRNEVLLEEPCDLKIDSTNLEKTLQRRLLSYLAENLESRVAYPPTFGATQLAKDNWSQTVNYVKKTLQEKLGNATPFFNVIRYVNFNHIGLHWEGHELEKKNSDQGTLRGEQYPTFLGADVTNFESVVLDPEFRLGSLNGERLNYNISTPNQKNRMSIPIEPDTPSLDPIQNESETLEKHIKDKEDPVNTSLNQIHEVYPKTDGENLVKESSDSGNKVLSADNETIKSDAQQQIDQKNELLMTHAESIRNDLVDREQNPADYTGQNLKDTHGEIRRDQQVQQLEDLSDERKQEILKFDDETLDQKVIRFLKKSDHKIDHITYCQGNNLGGLTIRGISPYLDSFFAFGDEFYSIFDTATGTTRLFGLSGYTLTYVAFLPTTADILGLIDDPQEATIDAQLVLLAAIRLEDGVPLIIVGLFDENVQKVLKAFILPTAKKIDSLISLKDGQSFIAITNSSTMTLYNILQEDPVKTYDVFQKNGVSIISCCALICRDYIVSYTSDSRISFFEVAYKKSSAFINDLETACNITRVRMLHNNNAIISMQATDSMRLDCMDSSGNIVDIVLYRENDKLATDIKIIPVENQSIDKFALTRLSEAPVDGPPSFMTFLCLKEKSVGVYDFVSKKSTKLDYSDLLEEFTNSEQSFFVLPFRGEKVEILVCTSQAIRKIEIW